MNLNKNQKKPQKKSPKKTNKLKKRKKATCARRKSSTDEQEELLSKGADEFDSVDEDLGREEEAELMEEESED
jgi:hypothetical protein